MPGPAVVAQGQHINTKIFDLFCQGSGQAHSRSNVFHVSQAQINLVLPFQIWQYILEHSSGSRSNQITNKQNMQAISSCQLIITF